MKHISPENSAAIQRITALWALSESGLGGIMFALKIPFTGFFIGAIAVVLLSLIARFSNNSFKKIMSATLIVVMVKAMVSPHSSPPAYFAVAFQGLTAAFFFSFIRSHTLACVLLGMVSMVESALQKIILLTLIFGKKIWDAFNGLFTEIAKVFSIEANENYAWWIIGTYLFVYLIWGAIVGKFASGVPRKIENQKDEILSLFPTIYSENLRVSPAKRKSRKRKRLIIYLILLLFIVAVFLLTGGGGKQAFRIIIRSVAAIILLFFVFKPVVSYLMQRWLKNRPQEKQREAHAVISVLPQMRTFAKAAYQIAAGKKGLFKKIQSFILNMIILSLYANNKEHAIVEAGVAGGN